jgi:dinuclear metal center YbgI/SA1388 family protein
MAHVSEVVKKLEMLAHPGLQESYDNAGLLCGNPNDEVKGILVCLDVTDEIIDEAIDRKCNLVVSHHPLIFSAFKRLSENIREQRILIKAIKNNIALYAIHTNLDNVNQGVSFRMAEMLGLEKLRVLAPVRDKLLKLAVFVPNEHAEKLRMALFTAGAGHIGNYSACSFNVEGSGSFKAGENTAPFVGEKHQLHYEAETRIEVILPEYLRNKVLSAMRENHPYEEVAYDLYALKNDWPQSGSGVIGHYDQPRDWEEIVLKLKSDFNARCIRHTKIIRQKIKSVALCGGSGSFLLNHALTAGADVFITADFKYHQFFDADNRIIIADIGHYESEECTIKLIADFLTKNFTNFATHLTELNTNPVFYS